MKDYEVVVVGAGLAGLQCARLLSEQGLRVLLVDRKESLNDGVHTTGIFVRRTLEDFDLPADCLGPPVRHVTLYSPRRRKLELESPYNEFRVGRMGQLYHRMLEQCLRAGVEWWPSTRYAGQSDLENGVLVRLERSDETCLIGTRFVVGADGSNSRVARALGLDRNSEWIVGVEEVLEDVPLNGPPRLHCFLDPKWAPGYLAWVTQDGEQVHIGVGGYPARFDPVSALQDFRASLNGLFDLERAKLVERRGGRIPVGGVLKRIANTRGLLVGDAAGAVSPLTAGGLDPCMRLSSYAAMVIPAYLDRGNPEALAAYSGEMFRSRFVSRLWMRRLISEIRQPAVVEFGCAAMRLPVLRGLAWHVFFGRGSFPEMEYHPQPQPVMHSP